MSTVKSRIIKATALGLALTLTHVCLSAELVQAATSRLVAQAAAQGGGPQGRLTTRGNNPVTVNGNSARSGETVFSGQTIRTPAGVGATVNLPGLGRVEIAPGTDLTLSYEAGRVNVTLVSGCAILTAERGTAGSVESGGTTQNTEGERGGVIDVCASATAGGAPVVGQGAAAAAGAGASGAGAAAGTAAGTAAATAAGAGGGLGTGSALALTAAIVGTFGVVGNRVISTPCRRGPNPSPGTPRGRNDECRD